MRHARLTWKGAYHHIFNTDHLKLKYISFLKEQIITDKIRLFAFCVMGNHFHFVLENNTGEMSAFMKKLNSRYGCYYRKKMGGKGYVFQGRFQSTIIENDSYLKRTILYILNNPVRAGLTKDFIEYKWSSASQYFESKVSEHIEKNFVLGLFDGPKNFLKILYEFSDPKLNEKKSKFGKVFGSKQFVDRAEEYFISRNKKNNCISRQYTYNYFESAEKIIWEFEKRIGNKIENIDTKIFKGKKLRGELLVNLKDLGGLKYSEISEFDIFKDIKFRSLPNLYSKNKNRLKQGEKK